MVLLCIVENYLSLKTIAFPPLDDTKEEIEILIAHTLYRYLMCERYEGWREEQKQCNHKIK